MHRGRAVSANPVIKRKRNKAAHDVGSRIIREEERKAGGRREPEVKHRFGNIQEPKIVISCNFKPLTSLHA
jgi:hypothetical protein